MRFALLGTVEVRDGDGTVVDLGGAQSRKVVAALLAAGGRVVTTEALIDAVWGDDPPASAAGTLQTYVSRLRRALEPDRRPRDEARVLVTDPQGYRLAVAPDAVDAQRFEALADTGRDALAAGRPADAVAALRQAEGLWRGPALAEYQDDEWARGLAARLEERRLAVVEQRLEAQLALGRTAEVAAEAAEAVRDAPLREGRWALLALSLYRAGRQGEALRALDDARRTLADELGQEPGRVLRQLEADILAHDPGLDAPAVAPPPPVAPVAPVTSGGSAPAAPRRAPAGPPLVGREAEMATLRAARDEATVATRFVVVEGEPGIGKTRLLEAVAAEASADGALVVWGRTHESGAAPAYWPWLGALREVAAARPEVAAALEPLLEPATEAGPLAEAGPVTFRLHEAVAGALEAAAAPAPLVVLLDDVQWADPASLELLGFLTTRLVDAPVLVGATLRTLEVGRSDAVTAALSSIARRPGSRRLGLRGLDEGESGALVDLAAGRSVAPPVAAAIHVRCGGNPFFAGELVRLLADEDRLQDAVEVGRTPVPAGVRDVLRRRFDRLPEGTLELLRLAAVLGRDLELPLLASASGRTLDECLDALEPAVAQRLLVDAAAPPATTRFAHALVREVLVEDMTSLRRARLHLRAADALLAVDDGDGTAELVAEHLWAAVPLGVGERAAGALEGAAEVAVRRAAFAAAEDLLRRAVSLRRVAGSTPAHLEAEVQSLIKLAGVARSLHGYVAILDLVDRGKELADRLGARDLLINLEWSEWAAADTACDFARADPLADGFRAMAEGADPDDAESRMLGYGVWGIHCWHHGRLTEAAAALGRSKEALAAMPTAEVLFGIVAEQRLLTEVFHTAVLDKVGELDEPREAFAALIRSQEDRFGRAMVAGFQGSSAGLIGDLHRSGEAARAGLEADPDVAFSFWGSQNQMHVAAADLAGGRDPDAAVALFEEGCARYARAGTRTGLGLFFASMALGLAGQGDHDRAAEYLARAQDELRTYGERWPEPVILLAEADLLARTDGDPADVAALFTRAEALATEQGAHAVARRIATHPSNPNR
jgi:DNA-binding SARP family transcriptional activator